MSIPLLNDLLTPMILIIALLFGMFFLVQYRHDKRRQDELNREDRARAQEREIELAKENKLREQQLSNEKLQYQFQQQKWTETLMNKIKEDGEREATGLNAGGYIVLDLPDSLRSMFHDLLK